MTGSSFDVFDLVMMTTLITVFNWNKILFSYSFSSKVLNILIIHMNIGKIWYGLYNCLTVIIMDLGHGRVLAEFMKLRCTLLLYLLCKRVVIVVKLCFWYLVYNIWSRYDGICWSQTPVGFPIQTKQHKKIELLSVVLYNHYFLHFLVWKA